MNDILWIFTHDAGKRPDAIYGRPWRRSALSHP